MDFLTKLYMYSSIIKGWIDDKITTHSALSTAHHTKYTDEEAVAAVDDADEYVKNVGDEIGGSIIFTGGRIIANNVNNTELAPPNIFGFVLLFLISLGFIPETEHY